EVNAADRPCTACERIAPHRADTGPDHPVSPERDLDALDVVAHVGMCAREVGEHDLGPLGMTSAGELLAHGTRVLVGERVVPGPHGGATAASPLVRGADVAKARAVAEHVIPRRRGAAA